MVAAGASPASSIDGLGIRLRVRGSSVSRKPVSRKSPPSPIRHEIPSVGSAIENVTVQPPLWRGEAPPHALNASALRPPPGGSAGDKTRPLWGPAASLTACSATYATLPVH